MISRPIDMPALADLFDDARILHRADFGALLTTTGHHPELGGFTVCQTIAGAWIVSALMPASDGACDAEAIAEAWMVIAAAQRAACAT